MNNAGLNHEDIELFYKLHGQLLLFANERKKLFENIFSVKDLPNLGLEKIMELRENLVKNTNLITSFVSENPNLLPKEELQIVENWKKGLHGDFYIVKYDKNHTIFYSPDSKKCYGVLHLISTFDEMLSQYLPILVRAWLIPFKDKITFDGLIAPYNISFGGGVSGGIKGDYEESIVRNGIITTFEEDEEKTKKEESKDEELLRFYLKSQANRDRYWQEIEELKESPELQKVYSQELGKLNGRHIKKRVKNKNVSAWFAVLEDFIVSSGKTKKELLDNLNNILEDKQQVDLVHIFKT